MNPWEKMHKWVKWRRNISAWNLRANTTSMFEDRLPYIYLCRTDANLHVAFDASASWWKFEMYRGWCIRAFPAFWPPDSALHWRHNGRDCVSNHRPYDCLLNRLFKRRSKKTSKLRVTGLCAGNSPGPVNSPHKWPAARKMFPFDDVVMVTWFFLTIYVPLTHMYKTIQCHNCVCWCPRCKETVISYLNFLCSLLFWILHYMRW